MGRERVPGPQTLLTCAVTFLSAFLSEAQAGPSPQRWDVGRVMGSKSDAWPPSPQGTATSTCFPRTGPRCHQPRSLSTSESSTREGPTDACGYSCVRW